MTILFIRSKSYEVINVTYQYNQNNEYSKYSLDQTTSIMYRDTTYSYKYPYIHDYVLKFKCFYIKYKVDKHIHLCEYIVQYLDAVQYFLPCGYTKLKMKYCIYQSMASCTSKLMSGYPLYVVYWIWIQSISPLHKNYEYFKIWK